MFLTLLMSIWEKDPNLATVDIGEWMRMMCEDSRSVCDFLTTSIDWVPSSIKEKQKHSILMYPCI